LYVLRIVLVLMSLVQWTGKKLVGNFLFSGEKHVNVLKPVLSYTKE
jgi:hypothetical protein